MYAAVSNGMGRRMEAVERVLHLLDNLPAEDPAADLVQRTMQRISDADSVGRTPPARPATTATGHLPHA